MVRRWTLSLAGFVATLLVGTTGAMAVDPYNYDENYSYLHNLGQIGITSLFHTTPCPTGALCTVQNGAGIKVGVFDTRAYLAHPDLRDGAPNGDGTYSARDNQQFELYSGSYNTFPFHATHVSGIVGAAIDNFGVVGVAPGATIYNYVVFDDNGWVVTDLGKLALDHAKNNGVSVVNMSYGPSFPAGDVFLNGELNLFKNYHSSLVIVRAAGNSGTNAKNEAYSGTASTDLNHILIVGSVDANNVISSFSNRPGNACISSSSRCASSEKMANFFLVAPGRDVLSDYPMDTGYYLAWASGTSMATPHVTGAVALLQSAWPFLINDPGKTATILKTTATDLGTKGVDSTYGWGLLNVPNAFKAQGTVTVATASTTSGGGGKGGGKPLTASFLSQASTLPGVASATGALSGIAVFDKFGRDYEIAAVDPVSQAQAEPVLGNRLSELWFYMDLAGAKTGDQPQRGLSFATSDEASSGNALSVLSFNGENMRAELGTGYSRGYFQASGWAPGESEGKTLGRQLLVGLNEAGAAFDHGMFADASVALSSDLSVAAFFGMSRTLWDNSESASLIAQDLERDSDQPKAQMFGMESRYKLAKDITLGVHYGLLNEENRFLGALSEGAFSLGQSTTTQTIGSSLTMGLADNLSVMMFLDEMTVNTAAAPGSVYQGVNNWSGQKFGTTLALDNVLTGTDRVSLSLTRPFQVSSGSGVAVIPVGQDINGTVIFQERQFDVSSNAMPIELNFSYVDRQPSSKRGISLTLEDNDLRTSGGVNASLVAGIGWSF